MLYYDLLHEEIFDGTGDAQFQVYRDMRKVTDHQWHGFFPETNALVRCCGLVRMGTQRFFL